MADQQAPAYFRRRAKQEQVAADEAADERAARSHRELAQEYRKLASGGRPSQHDESETPGNGILSSDFRIVP